MFTMVVKGMITIKRCGRIMKATENNEIHCHWVSAAIFHGDWKDRTIANFLGASLLGDLGVHPNSNVFYTKPMFWYDSGALHELPAQQRRRIDPNH